jgi:outer membrane receptor for monomeric catechols
MANKGKLSSVTQRGTYEPFDLQVARGQIYGHSTVNIYGFQISVTTTNIPVWEVAGAYTYPASAVTMKLASSVNTGQDLSGTTILIQGLDANYHPISET